MVHWMYLPHNEYILVQLPLVSYSTTVCVSICLTLFKLGYQFAFFEWIYFYFTTQNIWNFITFLILSLALNVCMDIPRGYLVSHFSLFTSSHTLYPLFLNHQCIPLHGMNDAIFLVMTFICLISIRLPLYFLFNNIFVTFLYISWSVIVIWNLSTFSKLSPNIPAGIVFSGKVAVSYFPAGLVQRLPIVAEMELEALIPQWHVV